MTHSSSPKVVVDPKEKPSIHIDIVDDPLSISDRGTEEKREMDARRMSGCPRTYQMVQQTPLIRLPIVIATRPIIVIGVSVPKMTHRLELAPLAAVDTGHEVASG
jgi:hypothetical protein